GEDYVWSASRLETYSTCPFMFFAGSILELEPRQEPILGVDARQLGNIYHHIFEALYREARDPDDLDALLVLLPGVANRILDEAPAREQFRITSWWAHSRAEIIENVRESLEALARIEDNYAPYAFEQPFGIGGTPPLVVARQQGRFKLRGFIDRVDRAPDGAIRVIDYKTAGPGDFTLAAVRQGKKLQLPLYAVAARDALHLGDPREGFYWHVRNASASAFTLRKFGPEKAMDRAVSAAWEIIDAVRAGRFIPKPPRNGCPGYCPAFTICWQVQPGYGS
ncbi:MAG: PD-(D/E)XK nuclease family protein, partial [Anaerolineae bacterium]|nr:PD-(D/E)XK nuclease family protein [Anaerolineae bacterium]